MSTQLRVALVGGDERAGPAYPPGVTVRRFRSSRFSGNGELRRVLAAITTGGLDAVVILVRWLGHPASEAVRATCRKAGIPYSVVTGGESSALRAIRQMVGGA